MLVRFNNHHRHYNAGEVASFPDNVADELVKSGAATVVQTVTETTVKSTDVVAAKITKPAVGTATKA